MGTRPTEGIPVYRKMCNRSDTGRGYTVGGGIRREEVTLKRHDSGFGSMGSETIPTGLFFPRKEEKHSSLALLVGGYGCPITPQVSRGVFQCQGTRDSGTLRERFYLWGFRGRTKELSVRWCNLGLQTGSFLRGQVLGSYTPDTGSGPSYVSSTKNGAEGLFPSS